MMRVILILLSALLFIAPARAQIAVTDGNLVPVTTTTIDSDSAPFVVELASWSIEGVTRMAWSGTRLAVAANDGIVLYSANNWAAEPILIDAAAADVALSTDGLTLAYADADSVTFWDVLTRRPIRTIEGAAPIAFSPDGTTLAYGDGGNGIYLWDMRTAAARTLLVGHTDQITDVVFSPDGGTVATTSLDTTSRLWDEESGEQTGFSRSRRRPLLCIEFSPSGALLASGAVRGVVRLNNLAVDTERVLSRALREDVTNIHFNPTGSMMLFTAGTSILLWSTDAQAATSVLRSHTDVVTAAVFNPSGTMIASAGADNMIRLWGVPEA